MIGLRAKTGRAIAIVVSGPSHDPRPVLRHELSLVDPRLPKTAQPYHAVMHLPWPEAQQAAQELARAVEAAASKSLAELLDLVRGRGLSVSGLAIVGSPERDLSRLGNHHIRAHAAEGILFRSVLERAAQAHGLSYAAHADKSLNQFAGVTLALSAPQLQQLIGALGRGIIRPWSADEKAAATAALAYLHTLERAAP